MTSDRTFRLADGRRLGHRVYGDPDGQPVFYFHGFPGSRIEARLADRIAARRHIRLIALDRPGFGLSEFKPHRTILQWPDDVIQLADSLRIERFAAVGVSGGGPYAAACALKIPQRLSAVSIVCGLGPLGTPSGTDGMVWRNYLTFVVGRRLPWLASIFFSRMARRVRRNPEGMLGGIIGALPDPDKAVFANPEVRAALKDNVVEAFRAGSRGAACELLLLTRPWGFALKDISVPVKLWHGEADVSVPPSMGRYQARTIPNCRAVFHPGEGHFSLVINHMEEILSDLLAERRSDVRLTASLPHG
jgi:pimeloyl-ACP methyl ester carboxylesterase